MLFLGLLAVQAALYPINPIVRTIQLGEAVNPAELHRWVFATATVPFLLYFALTIASRRQATLAMHWLGLRVTTVEGARVSIGRALVRSVVLLLPFELNHALMFYVGSQPEPGAWLYVGIGAIWSLITIYLLTAMFSASGQSIHDRVAGTIVRASSG